MNGCVDTAGEAWQRWTRREAQRIRQDWERCYLVETCERFFLGNRHEWSVLHPWFDMHDNVVAAGLRAPLAWRAACVAAAGLAASGACPALAGAAGGSAVRGEASMWGQMQRGFVFPIHTTSE